MLAGISSANACHRVKFRQNRPNGRGDIAILQLSEMAAGFSKAQILNGLYVWEIKSASLC